MQFNVLIIGDSRVKGLKSLIEPCIGIDTCITVNVCSGAKLDDLYNFITKLNKIAYDLIIVCGGICNLTEKQTIKNNKFLIYKDGTRKKIHVKETLKNIANISNKIVVGNITPACLKQYFKTHNPNSTLTPEKTQEIDQQQDQLIEDIAELNSFITHELQNRHVNLAKFANTKSLLKRGPVYKRKIKFNPNKLPDGVHPSPKLKSDWAKVICSTITHYKTQNY
jgi:hypothetical protein